MKTTFITLLTGILLVTAAVVSSSQFAAADFIAIAFTTGLVAWTVAQYRVGARVLTPARCLHLPINTGSTPSTQTDRRCAA